MARFLSEGGLQTLIRMIKNAIKGVEDKIVPADWEVTDPQSKAYIDNKPFSYNEGDELFLQDIQVTNVQKDGSGIYKGVTIPNMANFSDYLYRFYLQLRDNGGNKTEYCDIILRRTGGQDGYFAYGKTTKDNGVVVPMRNTNAFVLYSDGTLLTGLNDDISSSGLIVSITAVNGLSCLDNEYIHDDIARVNQIPDITPLQDEIDEIGTTRLEALETRLQNYADQQAASAESTANTVATNTSELVNNKQDILNVAAAYADGTLQGGTEPTALTETEVATLWSNTTAS